VVDDSALIRKLLSEIINSQPDMQAVGAAPDPLVAREMIRSLNPDVLTLDVEMPKMDGLDFLERLMRLRPMPVVMVSSLTERGSTPPCVRWNWGDRLRFEAEDRYRSRIQEYADEIADKIRTAAAARLRPRQPAAQARANARWRRLANRSVSTEKLIIVGASTGAPRRSRNSSSTCRRTAPASSSPSTCRKRLPSRSRRGSTACAASA